MDKSYINIVAYGRVSELETWGTVSKWQGYNCS